MFREMRRFKQALPKEECEKILHTATSGVLALAGDEGYPYAVPVSYAYTDGKFYFHSARQGHKIDAITRCDKASICVVAQDAVVPEEYTTYFRSVIAFGRIRVLDGEEKRAAAEALGRRYAPDESEEHLKKEIDGSWTNMCVLELAVEHMTGKEAIELVRARTK